MEKRLFQGLIRLAMQTHTHKHTHTHRGATHRFSSVWLHWAWTWNIETYISGLGLCSLLFYIIIQTILYLVHLRPSRAHRRNRSTVSTPLKHCNNVHECHYQHWPLGDNRFQLIYIMNSVPRSIASARVSANKWFLSFCVSAHFL